MLLRSIGPTNVRPACNLKKTGRKVTERANIYTQYDQRSPMLCVLLAGLKLSSTWPRFSVLGCLWDCTGPELDGTAISRGTGRYISLEVMA